jgi:hypothetical protein
MYSLFCVVLCIVSVYMCTVLLPAGGYPIAVNKYIISSTLKKVAAGFHEKFTTTYHNSLYYTNTPWPKSHCSPQLEAQMTYGSKLRITAYWHIIFWSDTFFFVADLVASWYQKRIQGRSRNTNVELCLSPSSCPFSTSQIHGLVNTRII